MKINEIKVNRFIAKSKIKGIDFVINPYVGCPNACMYCYATFIKKLSGHDEEWGSFLDVKDCNYTLKKISVEGKTYLMSSATDCYNLYEKKYEITRNILKQLIKFNFNLIIETKNELILRVIDLLKQIKNLKVVISLNTLDDKFRSEIEKNSTILSRLKTLSILKQNGIYTILNISPIFPYLTDYKKIIEKTRLLVQEYQFEFLNLKNEYKRKVLKYIKEKHSNYYLEYAKIYLLNDNTYFANLKEEIEKYCQSENLKFIFKSLD